MGRHIVELAITCCYRMSDAHVYTDGFTSVVLGTSLCRLYLEGQKILPGLQLHGCAFDRPTQLPVHTKPDPAELGKPHLSPSFIHLSDLDILWLTERVVAASLVKLGIADFAFALEEPLEGRIDVLQGLLQDLGRDFLQPTRPQHPPL